MQISRQTLDGVAAETGFQAATVERVMRLMDVLQKLSDDAFIGACTALKGGTALNLFLFDLDRLSVDIDLNYVGSPERGKAMEDKTTLQKRIPALMARLGYTAQRIPDEEHAGGKWRFRYPSAFGRQGTLEIDLNFMYRVPFFGTSEIDSVALGGYSAKNVQVVDFHEIVAGKLVALANRRASRDIFDAWRLSSRDDLDWAKVKNAMTVMGASARDQDWRTASITDYDYDLNEVQGKLLSCVPAGATKAHGGTAAWIETMIADTQSRLSHLYEPDAAQMAFLDAVYEEGRVDAAMLDADDAFKERVHLFPALAWKAKNVAEHLSRGKPAAAPRG